MKITPKFVYGFIQPFLTSSSELSAKVPELLLALSLNKQALECHYVLCRVTTNLPKSFLTGKKDSQSSLTTGVV